MNFGRTTDITRPPIAEINRLAAAARARGEDLIDLGQAVLGLPPPGAAVEAVRRYLDRGPGTGYSPDPGLPEARERVALFLRDWKGIGAAVPERIMLTCGANQAFVNALMTVTRPGDEVILFGPMYFDHDFAIRLAGCVPVEVPLAYDGERFSLDFVRTVEAITDRTRVVTVVTPGNPTGHVLSRQDMDTLLELCEGRGLWLLSDETYDLLTFPPAEPVTAAVPGRYEQVVVLGTFSKTFGLAPWRIGYTLGTEAFIEESVKAQDALVVCAPVPSQVAMMGALEDADYSRRARRELLTRRDALLNGLKKVPWLQPAMPDGATFTLCRLPEGTDSFTAARRVLDRAGIVTVPGSAFGVHGEGWLRLSFGNQPVERLVEATGRLAAI